MLEEQGNSSGVRKLEGHEINLEDLQRILQGDISYRSIVDAFEIPHIEYFNMASATVDAHASGNNSNRTALICVSKDETSQSYTYSDLSKLSDRFASFLRNHGVKKGDVIALFAEQGLECAMAHLGAYKVGGIVAPLSHLYGPEAVKHVLKDCGSKVIVTQRNLWDRIQGSVADLAINLTIVSGEVKSGEIDFRDTISSNSDSKFNVDNTKIDDPALLLYTSGSTGMPKGILHKQGLLRGYLSSVSLFYELDLGKDNQVLWTASDWSWVAGIFNVMLTGWYFGQTVVAGSNQFSSTWAFDFLQKHQVTHCFLTPTALKRLATYKDPKTHWPELCLKAIGTGGEPLPASVLSWAQESLSIPINEFYGLTEVNHLIGNCARLWPIKPGSMGRAYPGHKIAIINEEGSEVPRGTVGEIAAYDDDPTLFIGYWKNVEKTEEMRIGHWIKTGDFGHQDEDGYFWYKGREDDLIKSSGYRIGPAEIEDALVGHPTVAEAAVIGVADEERGQLIKAFVSVIDGIEPSQQLIAELQEHVKSKLAFFKYPRLVEFVDQFPLTSTGKINRKELRRREVARSANKSDMSNSTITTP